MRNGTNVKTFCFLIQQFLCRQPTEDGTYRDRMQLSSSPLLMISRYGYVSPQPCFANFVTPVHAWALFIYLFNFFVQREVLFIQTYRLGDCIVCYIPLFNSTHLTNIPEMFFIHKTWTILIYKNSIHLLASPFS